MACQTHARNFWSAAEDRKLQELAAAGQSPCAIAKAIGRSESSVYRRIDVLRGRPSPAKRPCLCCGKAFASAGPHNRLCGSCRTRQTSPYAP